ncbi:LLM class flavin-dependent oxidoreductase [Tenggerimyces flavus]|uniref:LLM class flavin-dependent oxidoreductase n=1 Tax=Tenggerimyces flavus TaxID=1708749 RepID=A0ABV7YJM7_9ACTN|nr:LLM class flavin-dependent oxidoreductase [Tenggerimyces flavus]MBM7785892.1 alkanesulfonate monooxygenase SsuD/methylene tetrahydromethanopterin reductase-like flavin-dependent oxidoreductase (luciferase family) [Tenggerimyces flavus]
MTKLGLNIRNFGPAASPEAFRSWATFAEDHGFAVATISDHVALTPEVAALYPEPFYDPFTVSTWLAGLTSSLRFVTSVAILPLRDPLLTLRSLANLDSLSGGRFVLGAGVGWSEEEYAAVGVPFRSRGRLLDERLETVVAERPVGVPVWVGGTSPAGIRRAVGYGDAWHPINQQIGWIREVGLPAVRAEALRQGRPMPAFVPRIRARLLPVDLIESDRLVGMGSLRQILADVAELSALGAEYVVLDTNADSPAEQLPLEHDFATLREIVGALEPA